jgi:large subunit ribosomal protein L22
MLAKQISGLPIDEAIIQMQFSDKMAGKWIRNELVMARNSAVDDQGAKRDKLIVGRCHFPIVSPRGSRAKDMG